MTYTYTFNVPDHYIEYVMYYAHILDRLLGFPAISAWCLVLRAWYSPSTNLMSEKVTSFLIFLLATFAHLMANGEIQLSPDSVQVKEKLIKSCRQLKQMLRPLGNWIFLFWIACYRFEKINTALIKISRINGLSLCKLNIRAAAIYIWITGGAQNLCKRLSIPNVTL